MCIIGLLVSVWDIRAHLKSGCENQKIRLLLYEVKKMGYRERKGWIIVEHHKNHAESPCSPDINEKGKYIGISGFGELFYVRKDALEIIKELEGETWPSPLEVRKAKLVWESK